MDDQEQARILRREKRERLDALYAREVTDWTDAELIEQLIGKYKPSEVPPCFVCGGPLSLQGFGGGGPNVWVCAGMEEDPEHPGRSRWQEGRTPADEHYSKSRSLSKNPGPSRRAEPRARQGCSGSRWDDLRRGGDKEVIELVNRFQRTQGK